MSTYRRVTYNRRTPWACVQQHINSMVNIPQPTPPPPSISYLISGTVTYNGGAPGFATVLEFTALGTYMAATSGLYSVSVPQGYGGTVTPHYAQGTFSPSVRVYGSVTMDTPSQDYAYYPYPLPIMSGRVLIDGSPVLDVAVAFTGDGQVTTDAAGTYHGTMVYGYTGAAFLTSYSAPDYNVVPLTRPVVNLTANVNGQDFAVETVPPDLIEISGNVSGADVTDGIGVEVTGYGTVLTDNFGDYIQLVSSGYSGTVLPHYTGGFFTPVLRTYTGIITDQFNQDFTFTGTDSPTDCPVPSELVEVTNLPVDNFVSRSVLDPVNNQIFYIDDGYDQMYCLDIAAGTISTIIPLPDSFGQAAIIYDPVNEKIVVTEYSGSLAFIDPVTKAVTYSNFVTTDPEFHLLATDGNGTIYVAEGYSLTGSLWQVSGATEQLLRSSYVNFSCRAICWADNINQLFMNNDGMGTPAFVLYNPATDTFAASVLLNPTVFRYECEYIPQTGHVLESYSNFSGAAILDIINGTNATVQGNVDVGRLSNLTIDTCNERIFTSTGFNIFELTLDGSYTVLNIHEDVDPNSLTHSRLTNLVYYACYDDGTIRTVQATRYSGSIGGVAWDVTQGVSPNSSGGFASAQGGTVWFSGSAVSANPTPFAQYNPQMDATAFVNLEAPYAAEVRTVWSGSLMDTGTIVFPSIGEISINMNGGTVFGVSSGTNGVYSGSHVLYTTVITGVNELSVSVNAYAGGNFDLNPFNTFVRLSGTSVFTPLTPP